MRKIAVRQNALLHPEEGTRGGEIFRVDAITDRRLSARFQSGPFAVLETFWRRSRHSTESRENVEEFGVLPERVVTAYSERMGDTLPPRRGHALEGVSRHGRATPVCRPPA